MSNEKMGEERTKGELWLRIKSIGEHTIVFLLILVSVWLIRMALEALFGRNAKLFKLIQIEYVTDFAYLLALIKYLWAVISESQR